jgi:dTDP-4-dehydrorhamnose reductase
MRVLLTGASGQLGGYMLRELAGQPVVAWSGSPRDALFGVAMQPVDLTNRDAVVAAFRDARPEVVIHSAAMAKVGDCFRDPERARLVNTQGTELLAELSHAARCRLIYVSTDLVFDGERGGYREEDAPSPVSVYGRTKMDGEPAVLASAGGLVARVSWLFGPSVVGRATFFDEQVEGARNGTQKTLYSDEWRTPLSLKVAARALVLFARSQVNGILHLSGPERMSRVEVGQRLSTYLGVSAAWIRAMRRDDDAADEPRPRDVSLDSSRWRAQFPNEPWPQWEESLRDLSV